MTHHHHTHEHDQETLTFDQKMIKLLEHWLHHNEDHAVSYRDWAEKAKQNGLAEVGAILEEAAQSTLSLNARFSEALEHINKGKPDHH